MSEKYAFKCATCGRLEGPEAAGDRALPLKCRVCGKGAHFDPDSGLLVQDDGGWIVLADVSEPEADKIAKFHAVSKGAFVRHGGKS